jgi:hypothetical protein
MYDAVLRHRIARETDRQTDDSHHPLTFILIICVACIQEVRGLNLGWPCQGLPRHVLSSSFSRRRIKHVKILLCAMHLDLRKSITFLEGSQASPVCPSGKSNVWVIYTGQCNSVHYKSRMD